jgi:RimJ/RimL family protein N-acetyltransferase
MERKIDATPLRDRLEEREITIAGKDGRSYVMRPIRSSDAPSLMRGYDAMTDNSKRFRMLHPVPHLTQAMALEFCTPDPKRGLCVVLEGCGELEGEILGGARIAGSPSGISAEFSVSLRPEAQDLGLARKALETVLAVAKEMGYQRIWGSIHATNQRMLVLAQRIGFRLRRDPEDVSLMFAELSL